MNFDDGAVAGQPETWNNFSSSDTGVLTSDLLDTSNAGTGIQLEITDAFFGTNTNGTTSASAPYPAAATGASFFDANSNWSNGSGNAQAVLAFSGLDVSKTYDFTFYASRTAADDNRTTLYTLNGLNTNSGALDVANNVSDTVVVSGLIPTASGLITLTITPHQDNDNSNQFIYLGVAELAVIPEPSSFALLSGLVGLASVALCRRRS